MSCNEKATKYVKFTFESDLTGEKAAMTTVTFAVKTDDALVAVANASEGASALFAGKSFKCKAVSVSHYNNAD